MSEFCFFMYYTNLLNALLELSIVDYPKSLSPPVKYGLMLLSMI